MSIANDSLPLAAFFVSGQEFQHGFPVHAGCHGFGVVPEAFGQELFLFLQLENLFFYCPGRDQLVAEDFLGLTNAVSAVRGLGFYGWVPPGVEVVDIGSAGEVETGAAGFEADEEDIPLAS